MKDTAKSPIIEKWIDEVRVWAPSEDQREEIRREFLRPLPEITRVRALTKTSFERQAFEEALAALNDLRSTLQLPSVSVTEGRMIVTSHAQFKARVDPAAAGKTMFGRSYVRRRLHDRVKFVHDLTHELVHLTAYTRLHVSVEHSGDGPKHRIGQCRTGLVFIPPRSQQGGIRGALSQEFFLGLDEGVTESIAHAVRRILVKNTSLLTKDERKELLSWHVYLPHVRLVDSLVNSSARAGGQEEQEVRRCLFADHMLGTWAFLRTLKRHAPSAVQELRVMGTNREDAFRTADALGIDLRALLKSVRWENGR